VEFLISAIIVAADQFIKSIVTASSDKLPVVLVSGILDLNLVNNTGGAFGMLKGHPAIFLAVSCAAIAYICGVLLFSRLRRGSGFADFHERIFLSMILGGAIGNLIDRARLGYVIDYLDFKVFPVFNLADSCITIGVVSLLYHIVFRKVAKRDM